MACCPGRWNCKNSLFQCKFNTNVYSIIRFIKNNIMPIWTNNDLDNYNSDIMYNIIAYNTCKDTIIHRKKIIPEME